MELSAYGKDCFGSSWSYTLEIVLQPTATVMLLLFLRTLSSISQFLSKGGGDWDPHYLRVEVFC